MTKLIKAIAAQQDLSDIFDFIARDKPIDAANWVETIEQKFRLIATTPEFGKKLSEYDCNIRNSALGRYAIFYRTISGGVDLSTALCELARSFDAPQSTH